MTPLYLAVDAGGTRTTFVLATPTQVLARVSAGSIKRMRVAADVAEQHLDNALAELTQQSGVDLSAVTRTCVGIAGQSVPLVSDWVRSAFGSRVGGDLLVAGDVDIALDAAFQGGRGVLVLAGTGSNVLARSSDGATFNVGGWGPVLGDQGSGYWIGRQAMVATFLALNAGRTPSLLEKVKTRWQVASTEDIVARAHALPPPDFAALSEDVAALAQAGDAMCADVLQRGGMELAAQAIFAIERVEVQERSSAHPPSVACAGSILQHVSTVRSAMEDSLRCRYPNIEVLPGVVDPVMGALWRARSL